MNLLKVSVINLLTLSVFGLNWEAVDLPPEHLPFYFNKFPHLVEECLSHDECPYKEFLEGSDWDRKACWGYEPGCVKENAVNRVRCPGRSFAIFN